MALQGFSHTGTPGGAGGLGADIRATMAGDATFTTDWTVHPEVLFSSGTSQRSYWVCEHINGHQVLFGVCNGSTTNGASLMNKLNSSFATNTAQTIWIALDINGGGVGTNSFLDNLNNNGLIPSDVGFWNQDTSAEAVRIVEWYINSGLTTLYFTHDDAAGHLLVHSNNSVATRTNSISVVCMSDTFIDDTQRPVGDRLGIKSGMLAVQADTNTGNGDVVEFELYIYPVAYAFTKYSGGNEADKRFYVLTQNSATTEPDSAGNYTTQTIPIVSILGVAAGIEERIRGIVNPALARFTSASGPPLGKRRDGGALMTGPAEMMFGWADSNGDIL